MDRWLLLNEVNTDVFWVRVDEVNAERFPILSKMLETSSEHELLTTEWRMDRLAEVWPEKDHDDLQEMFVKETRRLCKRLHKHNGFNETPERPMGQFVIAACITIE